MNAVRLYWRGGHRPRRYPLLTVRLRGSPLWRVDAMLPAGTSPNFQAAHERIAQDVSGMLRRGEDNPDRHTNT
jgi:hypothetical protein